MVSVEHDAGADEREMRFGKPDDGGAVCRMQQRDGETTLLDLLQHGTKYVKLSFRKGIVRSVCVGKVGHDAFDLEWISNDRVVEEGEQLFWRKSQPSHPGFDLEVN